MIAGVSRVLAGLALALLAQTGGAAAPAPNGPGWSLAAELILAADACSYAPPDLKRQLTKHRDRLMQGVKDAAAAESGTRDAAGHRAAAARGARALVTMVKEHQSFAELAYQTGGLVHEIAASLPHHGAPPKASRFLGYPREPFAAPETLVSAPLRATTPEEAYDAAVTLATRLLAWTWKNAGGDARIVSQLPEAKGPYVVRE